MSAVWLNLHHLRLFRAVARDSTLTGAARTLNLSQSALSSQIKTLEASLGHDLFERRGRGLVLTEAGRIALDHAEAIFRTADDLTATLSNAGTGRKALRVGALATLSRNFQIGFLEPLIGRSDVEVVLRSGAQADLLRALEALSVDVVLTNLVPARDASSPYLVHSLSEQPVSLIGLPPASGSADRPLADLLADEPLILPTPESALRASFDALVEQMGIPAKIAAEADDMAMLRLLARAGAGIAVIPPIVVRDELSTGALVELGRLEGIKEEFFAVTLHRRFPNPLVAELLQRFRNRGDWGGGVTRRRERHRLTAFEARMLRVLGRGRLKEGLKVGVFQHATDDGNGSGRGLAGFVCELIDTDIHTEVTQRSSRP